MRSHPPPLEELAALTALIAQLIREGALPRTELNTVLMRY